VTAAGRLPHHDYDQRLAGHYAPLVRDALRSSVDDLRDLVGEYLERVGRVEKRLPARPDRHAAALAARQELARVLLGHAHVDDDQLLELIRVAYGDAYLAGTHAAAQALADAGHQPATVVSGFAQMDASVDWSAWEPGWGQAANELAGIAGGRGLANLLANAAVTIRGIDDATLDELAMALADAVEQGMSVDQATALVEGIVGSETRAERIAHTEIARAMSVASLDTYAANGLDRWDWLPFPGACPICQARADANPHPMADDPPPGHPYCRCAAAPHIDEGDS
jgi:hypothetical protein